MAVREDILQGIRTWLKASESLTDAQVIAADALGAVKPTAPFLTVKVLSADSRIGEDELIDALDGGGDLTTKMRGERRATVSVQGFGAGAEDWLVNAGLKLGQRASVEALIGVGLTVRKLGAVRDISQTLDTGIVRRFIAEFDVTYQLDSDAVSEVAAATVEATYNFDGQPTDFSLTVTTTL